MRNTVILGGLLILAATLPASADDEDMERVQGRWQRLVKDSDGKTIRVEKFHKGNTTILTAKDEDGKVVYSHTSEFTLERAGKIRIFTYFNVVIAEGPNRGAAGDERHSYIYRVGDDRFVEVHGMLIGQEADEPSMIVWDRVKE